jgi:phosphoenolpyruvate carboxykinase (ATP)
VLLPRKTWEDKAAFDMTKEKLVKLFQENFKAFAEGVNKEILEAGPKSMITETV